MASADLLIVDCPPLGITIGVTYDTSTLQLTQVWSQNNGPETNIAVTVGTVNATLVLLAGRATHALPGGLILVQRTPINAPPALELPVNVTTRIPA